MPAIVNTVNHESIAEDLEIKPGDEILFIDNVKPADLLDYKYLISSEEITLYIKRSEGEQEIIEIEKDIDADLGIVFESAVFDRVYQCNNKCIFCFVDQQPSGLRKSLYVKDDDYRLSCLQGTYITLTNLRKEDKERIKFLRPGPLYVSVHTTNPALRSYMLNNPRAGKIMEELKWLNNLDIPIHAQIVVCPGINDGKELDRTLSDLSVFKTNMLSIAVVPVGTTKYRTDPLLKPFDTSASRKIISKIDQFNKSAGYNLAYASDEFYVLAGYDFPCFEHYNDFGQLDDGVGSSRLLISNFEKYKSKLPDSFPEYREFTVATGKIACEAVEPIIKELNRIKNLKINLLPVTSNFWGDRVTVSGLITGQDLLDNLLPVKSQIKRLILPSVMLRQYTSEFLDSITLAQVQNALQVPIDIIDDYYSPDELIRLICD